MAGLVSEGVPSAQGANASIPFGGGTQIAADQHALASQAGSATPQPGQGAPPQQPPQAPQQQAPPTQPDPNAPPTQPNGRLDMQQVFPPMPEMKPTVPIRDYLRTMAHHPSAGPNLARAAEQIKDQVGPLH